MLEAIVRTFLYHPTRLRADAPLPHWIEGAEEAWIEAGDGNRVHGIHWKAPEGRPTMLYLHGNAQSVYEWSLVAEELSPLECGLLLVDYPGYGKSEGSPTEEGLYAAGRAALDWLVAEGVAESSIVVLGKSLGGGVATEIVQGRDVMGLVLESTFRSIPKVARRLLPMIPTDAMLTSERYESISKIGAIEVPLLVVHGTADDLIPVEEGKALFEAANDPKELYLVLGGGHNDVSLVAGKEYGARIRSWLESLGGTDG